MPLTSFVFRGIKMEFTRFEGVIILNPFVQLSGNRGINIATPGCDECISIKKVGLLNVSAMT